MEERTVIRSVGQGIEILFEWTRLCARWEQQGRFSIGRREIVTSHGNSGVWLCIGITRYTKFYFSTLHYIYTQNKLYRW